MVSIGVGSICRACVPVDYRRVILDCLGGDKLRILDLVLSEDVNPITELLPLTCLDYLSFDKLILITCTAAALANPFLNK